MRRLLLPFTLLAAGLACKAPIAFNTAPQLTFVDLTDGALVGFGVPVDIEVQVVDPEGDAPITVTLTSDIDGELGTLDDVGANDIAAFTGLTLSGGLHQISATANDGQLDGERTISIDLTVNRPPSEPVISVAPANPTPADDIVGSLDADAVDPEGSEIGYFWSWKKGDLAFLTGSTFPATLPASQTAVGDIWTFEVEAFEAAGGARIEGGASVFVTTQVSVGNEPPTQPSTIAVVPSEPTPLANLACTADGSTDADGDTLTYDYAWAKDDGSSFVIQPGLTEPVLPASATAPGDLWQCIARANDGAQQGEPSSITVNIRPNRDNLGNADVLMTGSGGGFGGAVAFADRDGDGAADALATSAPDAASEAGEVYLFDLATLTSVAGPGPLDADVVVAGTAGDHLGVVLHRGGDVTGDGTGDLVALATGPDPADALQPSYAAVLDVAALTFPTASTVDLSTAGSVVTSLGTLGTGVTTVELTGDSRHDVVLGEQFDGADNTVRVLSGAEFAVGTPLDELDGTRLTSRYDDDDFGISLAVGDFTADGTDDLFVGALRPQSRNDATAALLFDGTGAAADLDETDTLVEIEHNIGPAGSPTRAGIAVGMLPDVDGDGSDEALIGAPGYASLRGRIGMFLGPATVPTVLAFANDQQNVAIEGELQGDGFGATITVLGDLDGDGFDELAVTAPDAATGAGSVYFFDGAALAEAADDAVVAGAPITLAAADAAWILDGTDPGDGLLAPTAAEDIDGDGVLDVVLSSSAANGGNGRVYAWLSSR